MKEKHESEVDTAFSENFDLTGKWKILSFKKINFSEKISRNRK